MNNNKKTGHEVTVNLFKILIDGRQQFLTYSPTCVGPHIPADICIPKVRDKRCFLEGANDLLEWG